VVDLPDEVGLVARDLLGVARALRRVAVVALVDAAHRAPPAVAGSRAAS
jgi:hypothetical protein